RPPLEFAPVNARQILFLDFDGARLNTDILAPTNRGPVELSPLRDFLRDWDLVGWENQIIDSVIETVTENFILDMRERGLNPAFDLEIRNSRDHADPYGQPYVSRVIVGGTIGESGLPAVIGIAQSVEVGNFNTEETAVVLLDLLSGSRFDPNSLNSFTTQPSDNRTKAKM